MKIYKVKVNGKVYEVELESVEENNQKIQNTQAQKSSNQSNHKTIDSPMQGTIEKILVEKGQSIKKGQTICILEAMKLENDITADKNYTVVNILVNEGDSVESDQPLIEVE